MKAAYVQALREKNKIMEDWGKETVQKVEREGKSHDGKVFEQDNPFRNPQCSVFLNTPPPHLWLEAKKVNDDTKELNFCSHFEIFFGRHLSPKLYLS